MKSLQTSDETCGNPDPFVEKKLRVFPEINFGTGLGILPVEVGGGRTRCRSVEGLNPLFFYPSQHGSHTYIEAYLFSMIIIAYLCIKNSLF